MKVFFAGHIGFGNRGCEALIRTITAIIQTRFPKSTFFVPSSDITSDEGLWPESRLLGVRFVKAMEAPVGLRLWNRARRFAPGIERFGRPTFRLDEPLLTALMDADYVIMTGGDNITLDYDIRSLYFHAAFVDNAKRLGKKVLLWGASVGPFGVRPYVERFMSEHLEAYDYLSVRESVSLAYLRGLGFERARHVADPAFTLVPADMDVSEILPDAPEGLVGVNVSPLIRRFRTTEESRQDLDREIIGFVRKLVEVSGYGVVLIPHVCPIVATANNSDYAYMKALLEKGSLSHPRLRLVSAALNAVQLKRVISKCRYFIGARTHATIAALSSEVPTISMSYSIKSKGINKDLFGSDRVILETPLVSSATLWERLKYLERHENTIRQLLREQIPNWKERAYGPLEGFSTVKHGV